MIDVEAQKVSIIISNMLIIYNYSGCQLKKISISKVIYYIHQFFLSMWYLMMYFARSFYQALTSYFCRVMSYKRSFFISISSKKIDSRKVSSIYFWDPPWRTCITVIRLSSHLELFQLLFLSIFSWFWQCAHRIKSEKVQLYIGNNTHQKYEVCV